MTNMARFDPFAELQALQKQVFGAGWPTSLSTTTVTATTDVYTEGDKHLVVEIHLPHFDQQDVSVHVDTGVLEIQAEKHEKAEDKAKKYVVRESSSSFYRRVHLPERADADNIAAHMENGVLKITVPFKQLPAPKKITISSKNKTSQK